MSVFMMQGVASDPTNEMRILAHSTLLFLREVALTYLSRDYVMLFPYSLFFFKT